jgi:hypothetical protein
VPGGADGGGGGAEAGERRNGFEFQLHLGPGGIQMGGGGGGGGGGLGLGVLGPLLMQLGLGGEGFTLDATNFDQVITNSLNDRKCAPP